MSFVRRPFLASGTDVRVLSEPVIYGSVHVNVDGGFDDVGAGSYGIELATESCASLQVTFSFASAPTLQDIVDGINTAASAISPVPLTASAIEGVLCLKSTELGSVSVSPIIQAFIEVLPLNLLGATDLAPLLGFYVSPHPAAKVTAGDLASSSPRAMTQHNRPSASFIARGEDRTSENFNRALHSLAKNLDNHQVKMVREVAVPVVLEVPEGSARLIENAATGEVDFIDLRTGFGDDLDAVLEGNIFVDLPETATIDQISKYFAIVDAEWNEILSLNRVVRVGTVAFAPSGSPLSKTTYDENGNALSVLLTSSTFDAFRNVLGHESTKTSAISVTEIIDGATIVAEDATFVTDGVEPGDIAELAGATDETPRTNIGRYVVDTVVSETMLIVRPETAESLHLLNPASGETITIRSNGKFESSLVIAPEPPLPRVPSGGIKIILGMQNEFGAVPQDFLLVPAVNSAEEVDGWVLRNLHRNMNLGGIYKGQGQDRGSGFFAEATHRPFTVFSIPTVGTAASDRTSADTAEILAGNLLRASGEDSFSLADLGRSINFVIAGVNYSDWRIVRWIDGRTVQVVPPPHQIGTTLAEGAGVDNVSSWEIFDDLISDFRAAFMSVTESPRAGGFHHIKMNDSSESGDLSFAHFEHVTQSIELDGTTLRTDLAVLSGSFATGGVITTIVDSSAASVDPDALRSVFPITHHSTSQRSANGHGAKSYVRVLTGLNAGLYEIYEIRPNQMTIRGLDGSTPTFTGTHQFSVLNLRLGVGVPVFGGANAARAGLSVFQESEPNSTSDTAYGIRVGWAGIGAGILVTANDSEFSALVGGRSVSQGPSIKVVAYAPADGISVEVASSSTEDSRVVGLEVLAEGYGNSPSFRDPEVDGADYTTGERRSVAALISQAGADPALVVSKADAHDTAGGGHTPSATAVFSRRNSDEALTVTGLGSAVETVGSIWVHGRPPAADGHALGGVFSEDVVAAGRAIYPMWGSHLDQHVPYTWAESSASYWAAPTTLGKPGIILPTAETSSDPTGDLLGPDFAEFNLPHSGILTFAIGDLAGLAVTFIGCIAEITESGHPQEGERYAIVSIRQVGTDLLMALVGEAEITAATSVSFRVHGLRWHRSYLDIADWFQVGTYQSTKDLNQLPLITSDPNSLSSRANPAAARTSSSETFGFVEWSLSVDGVGIGAAADYEAGSEPSLILPSVWSGTAENPSLTTPWASYAEEPRPPFYADEAVRGADSNFALADIVKLLGSGGSLSYVSTHGGGLRVDRTATPCVLRQRGRRYVWTDHLRVRAKIRAASVGTSSPVVLSVALVCDGTTIASGTASLSSSTNPLTAEIGSYEVLLSSDNVADRASPSLAQSRKDAELELRITIPLDATSSTYVFFQEIRTEHEVDPTFISAPVLVSGHVAAHGFRHANPVRGFQTLGPADVRMLDGADYGLNISWAKDHDGTEYVSPPTRSYSFGMQELRGGPGLIRTTSEACIVGQQHVLNLTSLSTLSDQIAWATAVDAIFRRESPAAAGSGYEIDLRVRIVSYTAVTSRLIFHLDTQDEWDAIDGLYQDFTVSPSDETFDLYRDAIFRFARKIYPSPPRRAQRPTEERFDVFIDTLSDLYEEVMTWRNFAVASEELYDKIVKSEVEDLWIQPEPLPPLRIGPNSATLTMSSPVQDPLWYALCTHLTTNDAISSTDTLISRSAFVPPGHTGFIIPLDPPHGAVLSGADVSLSFVPTSPNHWGIYRDAPESFWQANKYYTDISLGTEWEDMAGVYVEIWRFSILDTGLDVGDFATWSDHTPEYGYGELIHQEAIDLSESPPSQDTNSTSKWLDGNTGSNLEVHAGRELFKKKTFEITPGQDADLRVDRRHYAYAMVVRFIGGPRRTVSARAVPFTWADPQTPLSSSGRDLSYVENNIWSLTRQPTVSQVPTTAELTSFPFGETSNLVIYGKRVLGPRVEDNRWNESYRTEVSPQVKFRGARLRWITDRAGDKGWG